MRFKYFFTSESQGELDLESIGNFALIGTNDLGASYILIASTRLGITNIFKFGPFVPDIHELPKSVTLTYKKLNFSQLKMQKVIKEFLNNPFAKITNVEQIDKEEALKLCPDINEYFKDILDKAGDDDINSVLEELQEDEEEF